MRCPKFGTGKSGHIITPLTIIVTSIIIIIAITVSVAIIILNTLNNITY
jgi:hypothetical protein